MRELLPALGRWQQQGRRIALARVVDLEGSGPRDPGAAMAVDANGEVIGSVSGGCVEGAVVTEALDVLATGSPRLVSFGYSDDDAFAVGLTCGGTVHLFIEPLDWIDALNAAVRDHDPAVLATVVDGPGAGDKLLLVDGQDPAGDPQSHHENAWLELRAHPMGFQCIPIFGGEPVVAFGAEPGEIDVQTASLRRGDVGCHELTVGSHSFGAVA